MHSFFEIIPDIFDGEGAAPAGDGQGTSNGGSTAAKADAVRPEIAKRAQSLGLSKDMYLDYQHAYDSRHGTPSAEAETQQQAEQSSDAQEQSEAEDNNDDSDFNTLIKGKYKQQYTDSISKALNERMKRSNAQIRELNAYKDGADKILGILADRYKTNVSDLGKLFEAVNADSDIWSRAAIDSGMSTDEYRSDYEQRVQQQAEHEELEGYRKQDQVRQLDMKFQSLAKQVQEAYPEFDLYAEFENPQFCAALDYIANQNSLRNKQNGTDNEVYDLKFAYEMAHNDEIRDNTIKRTALATKNAVSQSIAARQKRPAENAAGKTAAPEARSVSEMSDEEFEKLIYDIKMGKAKIPR